MDDDDLIHKCPEKGCEHLMSWHVRVTLNEIRCGVPGCFCYVIDDDPCSHVEWRGQMQTAEEFFAELGIKAD